LIRASLPTRAQDWRRLTPSFFVSRTSRSRARLSSLASVGNITAFGCTVVSITTRARSDGFIASVRVARPAAPAGNDNPLGIRGPLKSKAAPSELHRPHPSKSSERLAT
jgi:hypothetical protein